MDQQVAVLLPQAAAEQATFIEETVADTLVFLEIQHHRLTLY